MFHRNYADARAAFRAAASQHGEVEALAIEARGPAGEQLTVDVVRVGPADAKRVLWVSSGVHGVEGFAGSAVQAAVLAAPRGALFGGALPSDAAVVFVHAVNPFGMAWLRRVNENGVDLNRNFVDAYHGVDDVYRRIDALLNPASPPTMSGLDPFPWLLSFAGLRHGTNRVKQAVAGGQYEFPRGLFYGGDRLQPSALVVRDVVRRHLQSAERVIAVDIHTGLGPKAEDTLLVRTQDHERLAAVLGFRVTPLDVEQSAAYNITGGLEDLLRKELPPSPSSASSSASSSSSRLDFITQEFGTVNALKILTAMRAENRHHWYNGGAVDHPSKRALLNAFCTDDDAWRTRVTARGVELLGEVLALL